MGKPFDVVIVGAGAAGIGCGIVLRDLEISRFTLLERYAVGASFLRWPAEMRFISPSFMSNPFGLLDLNAVALGTSPAYSLQSEHPTGAMYARYLQSLAAHFELPIQTGVEVHRVEPVAHEDGFILHTTHGHIRSRYVIWAAGEFQYPWLDPFPGAEHCLHNAHVRSWQGIAGNDVLVIGGYESGIDAAIHLSQLGKRVRVLDAHARWNDDDPDPSLSLSPFTHERLQIALQTGLVELIGDTLVDRVERTPHSYVVYDQRGQRWTSPVPPILGVGFSGSLRLISDCFEWDADGVPLLTEEDESTLMPGLFVAGPAVQHGPIIFCFIYKFRQRFAVVAQAIAERLGVDTGVLEVYRRQHMFLDDLSCCGDECVC